MRECRQPERQRRKRSEPEDDGELEKEQRTVDHLQGHRKACKHAVEQTKTLKVSLGSADELTLLERSGIDAGRDELLVLLARTNCGGMPLGFLSAVTNKCRL